MAPLAALLVMVVMLVSSVAEGAVVVVGGAKGWTTGVDYDAWATSQKLRVGDSLVFSNYGRSDHTVCLLDSADAYQRCNVEGSLTVHPVLAGNNYSMLIPASLEGKTLYAVCTGHCNEGQRMTAAVLPPLTLMAAAIAPDPSDVDLNKYICWTTAILLFALSFWSYSS